MAVLLVRADLAWRDDVPAAVVVSPLLATMYIVTVLTLETTGVLTHES